MLPAMPSEEDNLEQEGGFCLQTRQHTLRVEERDSGARLDAFLKEYFPQIPRTRWQERIRAGDVRINQVVIRRPARRVHAEDEVEYSVERRPEPEVRRDYQIVYEDESLLVVNKPPNLPVHPSGVYNRNTLYALLQERHGPETPIRFAHRLDRETSGLIVIARSRSAAARLQASFQARDATPDSSAERNANDANEAPDETGSVMKLYLTIVEGNFPDALDARGYLFPDLQSPVAKKRAFADVQRLADLEAHPVYRERFLTSPRQSRAGQPLHSAHGDGRPQFSRTEFVCLERRGGLSLVQARLHTGRMHQIRATLCSLGFPIVGDRLYGPDDGLYLKFLNDAETDADRARLRMERQALHAWRLGLRHPATERALQFEAPLPEDMRRCLEVAAKNGNS